VVQTGGRGGSSQTVLLMDSRRPSAVTKAPKPATSHHDPRFFAFVPRQAVDPSVLAVAPLFQRRRGRYTPPAKGRPPHWASDTYKGYQLLDATSLHPHWAVLRQPGKKRNLIGQLVVKGKQVQIRKTLALTQQDCNSWTRRRRAKRKCRRSQSPDKARMDHQGHRLFVALGRWRLWLRAPRYGKARIITEIEGRRSCPDSVLLAP
jgi:hypothetical protein